MEDFSKDIPKEIIEELNELGLKVTCKYGNPLEAVGTNDFVQKENKDKIKKLKELGWEQLRGQISNGVKYARFKKSITS